MPLPEGPKILTVNSLIFLFSTLYFSVAEFNTPRFSQRQLYRLTPTWWLSNGSVV